MNEDIKFLDEVVNLKDKKELMKKSFFWIYPFTNENISAYYSIMDFENKDVLCSTSSGDHILNAFIMGAKNVSSFDINPLAKYYVELKIAAIKTLSLEEFILFFYNKKISSYKYFLNEKTYHRISGNLDGKYRKFWDHFFHNYTKKQINKSYLISDDYLNLRGLLEVNSYLNEKNYYKLRNILNEKHINYYDICLSELNTIDNKFDIIILSNIPYFLEEIQDQNILKRFKDNISVISKDNSKVIYNYFYDNLLHPNNDNLIYNDDIVSTYFPEDEYEYEIFESAFNTQKIKALRILNDDCDAVLISKDKK